MKTLYKNPEIVDGCTKAECPVCEGMEHLSILEEHKMCYTCLSEK